MRPPSILGNRFPLCRNCLALQYAGPGPAPVLINRCELEIPVVEQLNLLGAKRAFQKKASHSTKEFKKSRVPPNRYSHLPTNDEVVIADGPSALNWISVAPILVFQVPTMSSALLANLGPRAPHPANINKGCFCWASRE